MPLLRRKRERTNLSRCQGDTDRDRRRVEAHLATVTAVPAGGFAGRGAAQVIMFADRDRDGVESQRQVESYRQGFRRCRWYLVAWDLDRLQWCSFRLDRSAVPRP